MARAETKSEKCDCAGIYCEDCAKPSCPERTDEYDYYANADPHDIVGGHQWEWQDDGFYCAIPTCGMSKRDHDREKRS